MKIYQHIFKVLLVVLTISTFPSVSFSSTHSYNNHEKTILFTTPRSGVNLVSCCMLAVTRKPIGLFPNLIHPRANSRLNLELISDLPFIYRTHYLMKSTEIPSDYERLIHLTRNPKELLFRNFSISTKKDLQKTQVQIFLNEYLDRFRTYENWSVGNRLLIFYEDVIQHLDQILIEILNFSSEPPLFWDDYISNKQSYINQIYDSYTNQWQGNHGVSAVKKPEAVYYTKDIEVDLLQYIDQIVREKAPIIWDKYLKRFETETPRDR